MRRLAIIAENVASRQLARDGDAGAARPDATGPRLLRGAMLACYRIASGHATGYHDARPASSSRARRRRAMGAATAAQAGRKSDRQGIMIPPSPSGGQGPPPPLRGLPGIVTSPL